MRDFLAAVRDHVVVYDGGMGATLEQFDLSLEHDYRLPGRCHEALVLNRPDVIEGVHESMIEAGLLLSLSREVSTKLVVQTMLGTARLLRDENMHPVELREMVTSPGGTTIRAIRELEIAGVRAAFLNAINAAMERSKELARGDA